MDRERALSALPDIYAAALRLRDAGLDDASIAGRPDMAPEAVGPLLRIAAAKLAALSGEGVAGVQPPGTVGGASA